MQVTYRKVAKALRKAGWKEIRCKGDHHQFRHPDGRVVTVPGKSSGSVLSLNVTKAIEKVTGLSLRR